MPSFSPENSPSNTNVQTAIDATMDVAAGKHALPGVSTTVSITLPGSSFPGYYYIVNANSGMVLDITGYSTNDGGLAIQWTVNGGFNQQWQLVLQSDGSYKLINRNSGKVLDNPNSSTTAGAQLDQWTDDASSNQWWQLVDVGSGNGYYYLVNDRDGLYMNVSGASTTAVLLSSNGMLAVRQINNGN